MSVKERVLWAFGMGIVAGMALMDFIHMIIKSVQVTRTPGADSELEQGGLDGITI